MRKPIEFVNHPEPYEDARSQGRMRAFCRYVVDGDTQDFLIDLGLGKYAYETVRLVAEHGVRYDAPEINSGDTAERQRGQDTKARATALVLNQPTLMRTYKDAETFGRYVAVIYYLRDGIWTSLADTLIDDGFVK